MMRSGEKRKFKYSIFVMLFFILIIFSACGKKVADSETVKNDETNKESTVIESTKEIEEPDIYTNDTLGYSIELPKDFLKKFEIQKKRDRDIFYYKEAKEDYGGFLLGLYFVKPTQAENMIYDELEAIGEEKVIYESDDYYVVAVTSGDVQFDFHNTNQAKDFNDMQEKMLKSISNTFKITKQIDFYELTHYSLDIKETPITYEEKDSEGNVIYQSVISEMQVADDSMENLNYTLKSLTESKKNELSTLQAELKEKGKTVKSFEVRNEIGLANQLVLSFIMVTKTNYEDGTSEESQKSYALNERGYNYYLHEAIRDQDKFIEVLKSELEKNEESKNFSKKWKNNLKDIFSWQYKDEDLAPLWYFNNEGLVLIFQGNSLNKLAKINDKVIRCDFSYENYPYLFNNDIVPSSRPKVVKVSTTEELISAIDYNTYIVLAPGKYNLSEYARNTGHVTESQNTPTKSVPYSMDEEWHAKHPNLEWKDGSLKIKNLWGLTITSGNKDAEIVTENPYVDTLYFEYCNDITLNRLIMGHDADKGYCDGSVIKFERCSDTGLLNMDLYGCGTYGITAFDSYEIVARKSIIHDCTYGILWLSNCQGFYFMDCNFISCKEFTLLDTYESYTRFTRCNFDKNEGAFFDTNGDYTGISFINCSFGENEQKFVDEYKDLIYVENK